MSRAAPLSHTLKVSDFDPDQKQSAPAKLKIRRMNSPLSAFPNCLNGIGFCLDLLEYRQKQGRKQPR